MMAIDYNLNNTELPVEKDIFIDNNILIYLFNPNTVNDYGYSNFLSDALEKNCKLYINSQVISELIHFAEYLSMSIKIKIHCLLIMIISVNLEILNIFKLYIRAHYK